MLGVVPNLEKAIFLVALPAVWSHNRAPALGRYRQTLQCDFDEQNVH
jgi:hypothetical protein